MTYDMIHKALDKLRRDVTDRLIERPFESSEPTARGDERMFVMDAMMALDKAEDALRAAMLCAADTSVTDIDTLADRGLEAMVKLEATLS